MKRLIRAIPNLGSFRLLLLGQNRLRVLGMRVLSAAITKPAQWKDLSLEKNAIGGIVMEGAHILVDLLLQTKSLETLNLSDDKLGIEGARIHTTALPHLYWISSPDLSDIWLRAEGMN